MQALLSQYFDAETLQAFQEFRTANGMPIINKMTELYSLYWCPVGITPNITQKLAKKHSTKLCNPVFSMNGALEPALWWYGNARAPNDCWIAFPNDVLGRNAIVQEQEALIPAGFEYPYFQDAVFCIFMRYACTRERIMPVKPRTYTRCQQNISRITYENRTVPVKLAVGAFFDITGHGTGLRVCCCYFDKISEEEGVAPVRKFY